MSDSGLTRKEFVTGLLVTAAATALPAGLQQTPGEDITADDLKSFEKIAGLSFTDDERKKVLAEVRQARAGFDAIRKEPIDYLVDPPTIFTPLGGGSLPDAKVSVKASAVKGLDVKKLSDEDIAFLSVRELGSLIKSKQLSPVHLTELYLGRLKRYGDKLLCLVTLLPERAMEHARQAEKEISEGKYRGPLHGIPYGIKDLFAVKGAPTTWGANTFQDQHFDYDCTVVQKLDEAGAILLAKLSNGALALGDVWFKGTTKNPWNPAQGSSGSSAGSASATAAGLVAFALGTETQGSIMSPSARCRVSGLRPTYGRVSRHGVMGLSYTMDKVGPICRQSEDCAIVFAAICGPDPADNSAAHQPFQWPGADVSKLKIGYLYRGNEDIADLTPLHNDPAVKVLASNGIVVKPVKFTPQPDLSVIDDVLIIESAASFDDFTRSGKSREMTNSPWPETFRRARFVPAVEYLQAMRARTLLMRQMEKDFGDFDVIVARNTGDNLLVNTNLSGHPQTIIPMGETNGNSVSRSFFGRIYGEAAILAVARAVQEATGFHRLRPDLSKLG